MLTLGFGFSSILPAQILLPVGCVAPRIAIGNRRNASSDKNKCSSAGAFSDSSFDSSYNQALKSVKSLIKSGVWDAYFLQNAVDIAKHLPNYHLFSRTRSVIPTATFTGNDIFLSPKSIHHIQRRWFKAKSKQVPNDGADDQLFSRFFGKKDAHMKKLVEDMVNKQLAVTIFPSLVEEKGLKPEEKKRIQTAYLEGFVKATEKISRNTTKNTLKTAYKLSLFLSLIVILTWFSLVGGRGVRRIILLNRNLVSPEEIKESFSDVKGVDEAKQELQEIIEFLKNPERFATLGGKLPKGVLLVGPPGTGKTLLARAVAGEAGVPFFHAAGPEFDEILVGQGARRVRDLFAQAKLKAPCVIFIDEIDSIGGKRTNSVLHPYANQTINQLLTEMDGFKQNEGVIVIGATNRRDDLDRALVRPGRFDVEVQVPIPDLKGREEILGLYLSRIKLARDVDTQSLAKRTVGFTGADLENLVNQAALRASIENQKSVSMRYFESARDKVVMGPERKHKIPDAETNRNTAYHEGGHALVALYTKDATPLHKVTILPRGRSLGHTAFLPDKEDYGKTRSQLLASLDCAMGGRAAEELIFGSEKVTSGAQSDLKNATDLATAMVKHLGMSEKVGLRFFEEEKTDALVKVNEVSDSTSELIDLEIKRLLQESYDRAKNILKNKAEEHRLLAEALLRYETLDAEDVKLVISGAEPKRKKI